MYTYFIIENEFIDDPRIKIGFSEKPSRRVKELQTGNSRKLEIMGWIRADGRSLETLLHKKYKKFRRSGEWFSIQPCDVLNELKIKNTSSFICTQSNIRSFLGQDYNPKSETLQPWEWLETDIEQFCPQCGWGGGVHYNDAVGAANCLKCGYPTF